MRRFFLEREKIVSARPILTGPDIRHIRTVLRLKPGDEILLFDGKGLEYRARITASTPEAIILSILERFSSIPESPVKITIGQALLKAGKMDRIVRQMTELGIYALIPLLAERSVPRREPERWTKKERRWETIARESLKQCGRSQMPRLGPPAPFKELVGMSRAYDLRIIFHYGKPGLKSRPHRKDARDAPNVLALIGPEGGFTHEEVKLALDCGFVCVSLGPRILKADTAAVATCAILQYTLGDAGAYQKSLDKCQAV
jgi:16S rRNA (uracil1498-N3)-methyltransferase